MTASTQSTTTKDEKNLTESSEAVPVKQQKNNPELPAWPKDIEHVMSDMFQTWSKFGEMMPFPDAEAFTKMQPDSLESWKAQADRYFDNLNRSWGDVSRLNPFEMFRISDGFLLKLKVDIKDDSESYEITAELPGLEKDDISLNIEGSELTISGKKSEGTESQGCVRERRFGSFLRSFTLPDGVDVKKVNAEFHNGVLTVTLPKTDFPKSKGKAIPIKG